MTASFTSRGSAEPAASAEPADVETTLLSGELYRLGQIVIRMVDGGVFSSSPWLYEKGALWDVGPHALSLLLPALGDVTAVVAGGGRGDQIHLVMRHADGASSTASLCMSVPPPATGNILYVYGPSGRLTAPSTGLDKSQLVEAHGAALDALINQIEKPGTGHACDVRFGLRVVQILDAAERSMASGHMLKVDAT